MERVKLPPEKVAELHLRLACAPKLRSNAFGALCLRQRSSVHLVAECLLSVQRDAITQGVLGARDLSAHGKIEYRVVGFTFQYDETSPKLRPVSSNVAGLRQTRQQTGSQVMVLSGSFITGEFRRSSLDGRWDLFYEKHPWHARSMRLKSQDADYLVQGLVQGCPFELMSFNAIEEALSRNDIILLRGTLDRAAANMLSMKVVCDWIWHDLARFRGHVMLHVEPCGLHGCALVKQRCPQAKYLSAAMCSLTRWLRISNNFEALASAVARKVSEMIHICEEPRPEGNLEMSRRSLQLVYGPFSQDYFWSVDESGTRKKKSLLEDLEACCAVVDLRADQGRLVCWNIVGPTSEEYLSGALPLGARINKTKEECVQYLLVPILNVVCGRAWVSAVESRWTNMMQTAKRLMACTLIGNVVFDALADIKLGWALSDSLEAGLAAVVSRDKEDFSARNRLRLLRICRAFGNKESVSQLVLYLICSQPIETLQYELFGHNGRRASVDDLVHPARSLLTAAQASFYKLASTFGMQQGDSPWALLEILGAKATGTELRMSARRHLLQFSAGVLQVYELRMTQFPYKLLWLCYAELGDRVHKAVVKEFFASSVECLGFSSRCLRELYNDEAQCLMLAPAWLDVWRRSLELNIDFSERAHAAMRKDLMSQGAACNFVSSCDRLLVHQAAADHVSRGGLDLGKLRKPVIADDKTPKTDTSKKGRSGAGGSAFVLYHNLMFKTRKELLAPFRPLSAGERAGIDAEIKVEWQAIKDDENKLNMWKSVFEARRRQLADKGSGEAGSLEGGVLAVGPAAFDGLWHKGQTPSELLPPRLLADFCSERKPGLNRESGAQASQSSYIGSAPSWKSTIRGGWGTLCGCLASPKNKCLVHGVPPAVRQSNELLLQRLNHWCKSLDKEALSGATELLLFEGGPSDSEVPMCWAFVLLTLSIEQPRAHIFACCGADDGLGDSDMFMEPQALPLRIRVNRSVARMSRCLTGQSAASAFDFMTSSELADSLAKRHPVWRIYPASYTMIGGASLLGMEVVAKGSLVDPPPHRQPRINVGGASLPDIFDMGDPFSFGLGGTPAANEPSNMRQADADSDSDLDFAGGIDEPPDDFNDDCWDGAEEDNAVPAVAGESADGEQHENLNGDECADGGEDLANVVEICDAAASDGGPASIEDAIAETGPISDMGYLTCAAHPWASKCPVGRITFWPSGGPELAHKQNMAIRCYMHPSCSLSRARRDYDVTAVLRWLYSMEPLPADATPAQKRAAKEQHMGPKAQELLPGRKARAKAAA